MLAVCNHGAWLAVARITEPIEGLPFWELVTSYMREHKAVQIGTPNQPKQINVAGNTGYTWGSFD
jgi:hypothetical protein